MSGTSWDNCTFLGVTASSNGIDFRGTTSLSNAAIYHNIAKCIFNDLNNGIVYDQWSQGITVTQCNFQNTNVGIYGPASSLGDGQAQLNVDNNQFAVNNNCILVNSAANSNGISLTSCNYVAINGNLIIQPNSSANATYGVVLSGTTSWAAITGNVFGIVQNGIYVGGTAANILTNHNLFHGVTTKISNPSGATSNAFYGDGQKSIANLSVGASPFTYTAGASPETHYINGGTVSLVEKGSVFVSRSSNFPVQLKPFESYTVTYSSIPNIGYELW